MTASPLSTITAEALERLVAEVETLRAVEQAAQSLADHLTETIADEYGFGEFHDPPLLNNLRAALAAGGGDAA